VKYVCQTMFRKCGFEVVDQHIVWLLILLFMNFVCGWKRLNDSRCVFVELLVIFLAILIGTFSILNIF
jgi:hypothetical protein